MKERKVTGELLNLIPAIRPGNFFGAHIPGDLRSEDLPDVGDGGFHVRMIVTSWDILSRSLPDRALPDQTWSLTLSAPPTIIPNP
jgi:hypothetical protein